MRWLPALAIAGTIFWLSHQPSSDLPGTGIDKIEHAVAYGLLTLSLWFAFGSRLLDPRAAYRRGSIAVVIAAVYGLSDEFHQSFISGRDPSAYDWIADVVGAVLVVAVLLWASFAGLQGVWDNRHR